MSQHSSIKKIIATLVVCYAFSTPALAIRSNSIKAVLWSKTSGESAALYYQAYNLARTRLDEILKTQAGAKPRAIIFDIDETVLDNSPYQATATLKDWTYPQGLSKWFQGQRAKALPGTVEFCRYAAKHNVTPFFITNREDSDFNATLGNLHKQGFPVTPKTLLTRENGASTSKESRRQKVLSDYDVVLLLGDNLNDFDDAFYHKSVTERRKAVDHLQKEFGTRFIILPNPVYGDWESALYDYNPKRSPEELQKIQERFLN